MEGECEMVPNGAAPRLFPQPGDAQGEGGRWGGSGLSVGKDVCSPYAHGWGGRLESQVQSCALGRVRLETRCPERVEFLCQTLVTSRKYLGRMYLLFSGFGEGDAQSL